MLIDRQIIWEAYKYNSGIKMCIHNVFFFFCPGIQNPDPKTNHSKYNDSLKKKWSYWRESPWSQTISMTNNQILIFLRTLKN